MLRRLLRSHLGPYKKVLLLIVVLQGVQTFAALVLPTLNARVIDNGVLPGDVGYFHQEPGLYATSPNEVAELVYVYDRGVAIKAAEGHDGFVNLFAQLRLESAGEFLAASKRVRWDGPFTLRVERGTEG